MNFVSSLYTNHSCYEIISHDLEWDNRCGYAFHSDIVDT
jgi:hypothetical protein